MRRVVVASRQYNRPGQRRQTTTGYPVWQCVGGAELLRDRRQSGEQGGSARRLRVWNRRKPSRPGRADAQQTSALHELHREVVQHQLHRTGRGRHDLLPRLFLHSRRSSEDGNLNSTTRTLHVSGFARFNVN